MKIVVIDIVIVITGRKVVTDYPKVTFCKDIQILNNENVLFYNNLLFICFYAFHKVIKNYIMKYENKNNYMKQKTK